MQKIYLVWANADSTEGRGPNVIVHICSNEVAANDLKKGLGPMGMSDGYVTEDFLIDSRLELEQKFKDKFIREEALKKLSPEEKRVLGVK